MMASMSDDIWRDTTPLRAPTLDRPIEPRSRRPVVISVLVSALVLGAVTAPMAWFVATYGCDGGDAAYTRQLAQSDVLDLAPTEATPVGGRDTGCEDDDEMAMASQDYRRGGLTPEQVLSYYDQALTKAGWRPASSPGRPGCWNRHIGQRGVSLFVEQGYEPEVFTIELSSQDKDGGGGWCSE